MIISMKSSLIIKIIINAIIRAKMSINMTKIASIIIALAQKNKLKIKSN
jgi:hypothetical protein